MWVYGKVQMGRWVGEAGASWGYGAGDLTMCLILIVHLKIYLFKERKKINFVFCPI